MGAATLLLPVGRHAAVGVTVDNRGRAAEEEQGSTALVAARAVAVGPLVQVDTDSETTAAAVAPVRTTVGGTRKAGSRSATTDVVVGECSVVCFLCNHAVWLSLVGCGR